MFQEAIQVHKKVREAFDHSENKERIGEKKKGTPQATRPNFRLKTSIVCGTAD